MCIYRVYAFMDCKGNPQNPSYGQHSLTTESRNANFKAVIIFQNWISILSGDCRYWPFGHMTAFVDQDCALERHDHGAILLEASGFDSYYPHMGPRF